MKQITHFHPSASLTHFYRNVRLLFKKPMRSTGNEQFSVYVYYKTNENNELEEDEDY